MNAQQYNKLNELLATFSTVATALERAEAGIKTVQIEAAKTLLPEFAQLKIQVSDLECEIRKQCDAHYEALFPETEKRTHKTPFGEVKFHKSSCLEFEDEEKVVLKITLHAEKELARAQAANEAPRFTAESLLRTTIEPNLNVLDTLDDAILSLFGVRREHKDNFKVTAFAMKTDKPAKTKTK